MNERCKRDVYVPLRVRSNYTLLRGASTSCELLQQAGRFGLGVLALTDENNMYNAVPFLNRAEALGVRPVLGTILRCNSLELLLLFQDAVGYANGCDLLTSCNLEGDPETLLKHLSKIQAGLFVLCRLHRWLPKLAERLDKGRLWAELCRPARSWRDEERLLATAKRLGLRVVATNDVFYAEPAHANRQRMLSAIQRNCLLSEVPGIDTNRRPYHLLSAAKFSYLFRDYPQAVAATQEIADACSVDLRGRPPVFPQVGGNVVRQLRQSTYNGARFRYERLTDVVSDRIEYELGLIIRLGFADYFLLVADIVKHARELGTPVAGRGSGASSIVAYCLRITNVDPLRYKLPFERFLNEGRQDFPDLDIDLCWRLRDEVIDYVYKKYGDDHVAMISMYAAMQPRMAFRLTAKAFGLPRETTTQIQHMLHHFQEPEMLSRGSAAASLPVAPDLLADILSYARALNGFPHHLSIHPGGIVITPTPLRRHVPLERAAKGVVITQFDKDAVESIGLIKIDLLGNRALSCFSEARNLVRRRSGRDFDPETLTERDPATAKLLRAADTVGVNQLESPAMRNLVRQLRSSSPSDLMKALALIRPGAASLGMKQAFVRRSRGLEGIPPIDPRLDHILRETHGIMLYEDEALQIAGALAGLRPNEADRFRKAVTKCRSDEARLKLSTDFLQRCKENDVDRDIAIDLWTQMAKFNSYSFCRAHAASYGRLAWANAYMKAHHPLEFWVGALNNNEGMYDKWVYVEEAKRGGIPFFLPCVHRSADEFSVDHNGIRVGLNQIRGLSVDTRRSLFESRPFRGIFDLVARTQVGAVELDSLIHAGALDVLGASRPRLLLLARLAYEHAAGFRSGESLFPFVDEFVSTVELEDYSPSRKYREEWQMLGISVRHHPVVEFRCLLSHNGFRRSAIIPDLIDSTVRLCGMLAASRTVSAERCGRMCFMTFSDEDGLFEVVLMPDMYDEKKAVLAENDAGIFCIAGQVQEQYDSFTVVVDGIDPLDEVLLHKLKRTA